MPLPPVCSTRWHGTRIGIGFAPSALPAARLAFGLPASAATFAYVEISPNGIVAVAARTLRPEGLTSDPSIGRAEGVRPRPENPAGSPGEASRRARAPRVPRGGVRARGRGAGGRPP